MILTRKIEIYVDTSDTARKKECYLILHRWRYLIVAGANELVSFLYSVDRIKYYRFITEKIKFNLDVIGSRGELIKDSSVPYVLLTERMKGEIPSDIINCLQKSTVKKYLNAKPNLIKGRCSLFTYKDNTPIPFSSRSICDLKYSESTKKYTFSLFGIGFALVLGRDRSNNRSIIDNCISGSFKIRESSIMLDDSRKKMFLLLSYEVNIDNEQLDDNLCVNATLSIDVPIIASFKNDVYKIGNKEEFLYRRLQIQSALRRAQRDSKYSSGGRGRKKKLQAIDRFHNKEKNYIKTKIHTYSRLLVNYASNNKCKYINIINQNRKEDIAKNNSFILRNWSYYDLKKSIEYKSKALGIEVNYIDLTEDVLNQNARLAEVLN